MPLRVPGRPLVPPKTAGTGSNAKVAWDARVRPVALPLLSTARPTGLGPADVMSAHSAVRQLLDGSLLAPNEGLPAVSSATLGSTRGPAPAAVNLPPDLRALLFLRGMLRDVANAAATMIDVRGDTTQVAQRVLRQFEVYDFGAWVVATAIMGRYDSEVAAHAAHRFGDCPCAAADSKEPLFRAGMQSLAELRTMWNLRVLARAAPALEAAVLGALRQTWLGEEGDLQLVRATLAMAGKTGGERWIEDVIIKEWTQRCHSIAHAIPDSGDLAGAASSVQQQLQDARSRVIDPLPREIARPMLAVAASCLVLARKPEWTVGIIKWFREGRHEASRALWKLRTFAVEAGASPQWYLDGISTAAKSLVAELVARLDPHEVKASDFQKSIVDDFEETVFEFADAVCGGNEAVRDAALDGGYSELFYDPPVRAGMRSEETGVSTNADFFAHLTAQLLNEAAHTRYAESRERSLDSFMRILARQESKDLCLTACRKYLEQRLLQGHSLAVDFEHDAVQRIQASGQHVAAKEMLAVLTDAAAAAAESSKHCVTLDGEPEYSVLVLKTGAWQTLTPLTLHITMPVVSRQLKRFIQRYRQGPNEKRSLSWCHGEGIAKVTMLCVKSKHTLQCPLATALMLCTFDAMLSDELPVTDLEASVLGPNAQPDEPSSIHVARCLKALLRSKVLVEKPGGLIKVNRGFRSTRRETVLLPKFGTVARRKSEAPNGSGADGQARRGDAAGQAVAEVAQVDHGARRMLLDSALVRVLKARRVVRHAELVETVVETLRTRFVPSPADVKKAIERLLDQEYCERVPNDPSCYSYLA